MCFTCSGVSPWLVCISHLCQDTVCVILLGVHTPRVRGVRGPFRFIVFCLASVLGEVLPAWVGSLWCRQINLHAPGFNSKAADGVNSFPRAAITD